MNNFKPPESNDLVENDLSLSGWVLPLSITLTVISLLIYSAPYNMVPSFEELWEGFGAELPFLTLLMLKTYKFYALLAFIGIIPCVILFLNRFTYRKKQSKLFIIVLLNLFISFSLFAFVIIACYLPIFALGSVV